MNPHADKPVALPVQADVIPAELRQLPRWLVWRYVEEIDRETGEVGWNKPPLNARGGAGSSTNPDTWSSFDVALSAYRRGGLDGLGFAVATAKSEDGEVLDGEVLIAVDLDHCRNPTTGEIDAKEREIIAVLNSYTEVSPSGEGIRIFLRGRLPEKGRKSGDFECYCTGRYVTVTGQHVEGTPRSVEARAAEMLNVHERIWPEYHRQAPPPARRSAAATPVDLSDLELIEKAKKARNGAKFGQLWEGGHADCKSASEADLALCSLLAFWSGPNGSERVDALFRQSGLYRSKWDRSDYRQRTIARAYAGRTEFYEPRRRSNGHSNDSNGTGRRKQPGEANGDGGDGHRSDNGQPNKTSQADDQKSFALGPLTIRPGQARQTQSGKISVPANALRDGHVVYPFVVTTAASGRKEAARVLAQILGGDPAVKEIDAVLTRLLAFAAESLARRPALDGPTLRDILTAKAPAALQLVCRTARGLWSEARGGEISRADFLAFVPDWLLVECGTASDAPRDANGNAVRSDLIRVIQLEMGVLWADLLSTLPSESEADLGEQTEKGRVFRAAMVRLWKTPATWERVQTAAGDSATKASLASRVATQQTRAVAEYKGRDRWQQVHPACDAWWRTWTNTDGELRTLLAMRWTLPAQVGVDLPGVRDEPSLTRLGMQFKVLTNPPGGIPSKLSGGTNRVAVLALDLAQELLEMPSEDAEDTPREPGS